MSGLRYPVIDTRRASALRDELLRMAPSLVPEWSALSESGMFGEALLEIAGRLGEHTTRRLDQTPRRDALAFFDTLDIPPAAPRAAEATLVFSLVDKRQTQVLAPARTQVATPGKDGKEVIFETVAPFAISPAKLGDLIGVDAAADRVERAPAGVTVAAPPEGPEPVYRVASFADTGSTDLQVAPTIGLAEGDMIRLGDAVYRIAAVDGAILDLLDPLEAPAVAGELLLKASAFETFDMRDLQVHAFYIGHAGLLNLEQAAKIVLDLAPDSLAGKLGTLDIAYTLWGTRTGDEEPAWHALDQLGASGNRLQLFKGWTGSVDEIEVNGVKNRWLRAKLQSPIAGGVSPGLSASRIGLLVESDDQAGNDPANAAFEGSKTIAQAFHNNTPLPLASRFFPFGPEPQRFDTFSLAAPEALSKPGAQVVLDVALADATLERLAMAVISLGPTRAYGIGRNGKLQGLAFESDGTVRRQELDPPDTLPTGDEGQLSSLRLDGAILLQAVEIGHFGPDPIDLVVAADQGGRLWGGRIRKETSGAEAFRVLNWRALPKPLDDIPLGNIVLLQNSNYGAASTAAFLFVAGKDALSGLAVSSSGIPIGGWKPTAPTGAAPDLSGNTRLVAVQGDKYPHRHAGPNIDLVLIDSQGAIWRAIADAVSFQVVWDELEADPDNAADLEIVPAATLYPAANQAEGLWVAAARASDGSVFALRDTGGPAALVNAPDDAENQIAFMAPKGATLLCDPTTIDFGADQPLTAAVGSDANGNAVAMVWTRDDHLRFAALPEAPPGAVAAFIRPDSARGAPDLVIGGAMETIYIGGIDWLTRSVDFQLHDALYLETTVPQEPDYSEINAPNGDTKKRSGPEISVGKRAYNLGPVGSLTSGVAYRFLRQKDGASIHGGVVDGDDPTQLTFAQSDDDTQKLDEIVIGTDEEGAVYAIDDLDDSDPQKKVATLDRAYGGTPGSVKYVAVDAFASGSTSAVNIGTLALLTAEDEVPRLTALRFQTPADPILHRLGAAEIGNSVWAWLIDPWISAPPVSGKAELLLDYALASWASVPFERSYQNPELSWEYFDGDGWRRIEKNFQDATRNFESSGPIYFSVPDDIATTDVAGQDDYWIRARLIGGDFGRARYIVETDQYNQTQTITVDTSELRPPEIARIEATFKLTEPADPEHVLAENNLATLDQTQASAVDQAHFDLFEGLAALVENQPDRAVFLGFTKPIDVNPLSLYVDAAEQTGDGILRADILGRDGWHRLTVDDKTDALRRRGYLKLFVNIRSIRSSLFGTERHWVRLRLEEGSDAWAPRVKGFYVNAARAVQAKTIKQEIIGSSLGEPGQSFPLSESPVLPETLELRVREVLSDEERETLQRDLAQRSRLEGLTGKPPLAVATYPNIDGEWVLWRRVDSFVGLDGDARVFRFSPGDAICTFGDNQAGKIPPAGRDAIRAIIYQNGGGESGNVPAYSLMKLKSSLESLDEVVLPVDATGGVNAPGIDALVATSPARLRHVSQALAIADFEAIATASSPDIVRALCIEPQRPGDPIRVVIALHDGTPRPVPTLGRREALARLLRRQGWGALKERAVRVDVPDYWPLTIVAELLADEGWAAAVEDEAAKQLVAFLHPSEGGEDGTGWPFGRRVWPSDLLRLLSRIDGVDRIASLDVAPRDPNRSFDAMPAEALICVDPADIDVRVVPGGAS